MTTPDLTAELSFDRIDDECIDTLQDLRVVVMKGQIPLSALDGVETAYRAARKRILPRRITRRVMSDLHLRHNRLYRALEAPDVEADPATLPDYLGSARVAIDAGIGLNDEFFTHPGIRKAYGGIREINLARFALSLTQFAFPPHQDSRGKTGLGLAAQTAQTLWGIHRFQPHPPAPVEFVFTTEPGDYVVLMERAGPCPEVIPFRQGESEYFEDASRIHSGLCFTGVPRGGLGLFHREREETKQIS